jgi:lipopolysaccharide/colanic/teichoic acid biosynthesis glycosyltransferase
MSRVIKRSIDVSVAAVGLVLVGPVALCLALLIYLVDGRPVLVLDPWIDRRGKSITLTAFRTHRGQAFSREDGPPLPWVGRYLQQGGLEKLPRLWDLLSGRCELDALWR